MRPIKNKRKIDPRYFLYETTHRDELNESGQVKIAESGSGPPHKPETPDTHGTGSKYPHPKPKSPLSESLSSRYGSYHSETKQAAKKRQLNKNTKYKYKLNK